MWWCNVEYFIFQIEPRLLNVLYWSGLWLSKLYILCHYFVTWRCTWCGNFQSRWVYCDCFQYRCYVCLLPMPWTISEFIRWAQSHLPLYSQLFKLLYTTAFHTAHRTAHLHLEWTILCGWISRTCISLSSFFNPFSDTLKLCSCFRPPHFPCPHEQILFSFLLPHPLTLIFSFYSSPFTFSTFAIPPQISPIAFFSFIPPLLSLILPLLFTSLAPPSSLKYFSFIPPPLPPLSLKHCSFSVPSPSPPPPPSKKIKTLKLIFSFSKYLLTFPLQLSPELYFFLFILFRSSVFFSHFSLIRSCLFFCFFIQFRPLDCHLSFYVLQNCLVLCPSIDKAP